MLIVGCGNMGSAMLRGWIAGGMNPRQFVVIDPFADNVPDEVTIHRSASEVDETFDTVLLGIKPQMIHELAASISVWLKPDALLLSILAGIEVATLSQHFPTARIFRLMPNLAAAIGKSPLGLWSNRPHENDRYDVEALLTPLGSPIWLTSEEQMNVVTALAGSGPAFVYRFISALADGATQLGLPLATATQLATATVEGAALLAAQSGEPLGDLAARVTSPGGTTAAGLDVLDRDGAFVALMKSTLRAARDRGVELGQTSNGDKA